jgi:chromosome segregation protein
MGAALDDVAPQAGLEAALAAALGDDLDASLDARALRFWGGAQAQGPSWPEEVTPLAPAVAAPSALAARLAFVGLVARAEGPRLQPLLPPGARLVSREGDLWRWDGFTVKAEAPRPAQVRLEQKSRLAALEGELARQTPLAAEARRRQEAAAARLAAAERAATAARARPRGAEVELARARDAAEALSRESARREARAQALDDAVERLEAETGEALGALASAQTAVAAAPPDEAGAARLARAREIAGRAREAAFAARAALDRERAVRGARARRLESLRRDHADWTRRARASGHRLEELEQASAAAQAALETARDAPEDIAARRLRSLDELAAAEARASRATDALAAAEAARAAADRAAKAADARAADQREARAGALARLEAAVPRLEAQVAAIREAVGQEPEALGRALAEAAVALPTGLAGAETHLTALERERDALGPVNLLAEDEVAEVTARLGVMAAERADLSGALARLRQAIEALNAEGRERLTDAFRVIDGHFRDLFTSLFQGGAAELRLVESEDPLEAGLEILACPPGKRMAVMSLMSGGEQALTAVALIFAVFLANPAPICVLDEVDAPLDDANVQRFCDLLAEMRRRASTRFLTITHNPLTMSRMDRLFGVTMRERGVSQLVSVDLRQAEALAAR